MLAVTSVDAHEPGGPGSQRGVTASETGVASAPSPARSPVAGTVQGPPPVTGPTGPSVRLVAQSHPDVQIAEPYYGDVGEDAVRLAGAVTGSDVGLHLDREDAEDRVRRARAELEPVLAVAGITGSGALPEDLAAVARTFGVEAAAPFDSIEIRALREVVAGVLAPTLVVAGVQPGDQISAGEVRAALANVGHDPGRHIDVDDVRVLQAATQLRVAPLLFASGHDPGTRLDVSDLDVALRAVGHDPGQVLGPDDVAAGVARSTALHVSPPSSVSPGLEYRRIQASLPGGPLVGHLLRWRLDDPRVQIRPEQTGDFGGRVSVPTAVRARPGAVAGVNGGFWLDAGDPDGLLVTDGTLVSDPTALRSWVRGRRGGFAIGRAGASVGRPDWNATIRDTRGATLVVRGVNRAPGAHDVVVYTPAWGASTRTSPGTAEVTVAASSLLSHSDEVPAPVTALRLDGDAPIVPGQLVLAATDEAATRLLDMAAHGPLTLVVDVPDPWDQVDQGLGGGPLMLVDGRPTPPESWRGEGFTAAHTDRRHPRTLIGFDRVGYGYALVLDGRRPGYSVGATQAEATRLARALGLVDATMMDGGGSSQMVLGGQLVNAPCCDSRTRPVATAIVFYAR